MDWQLSTLIKPRVGRPVLGYWTGSKAFLVVIAAKDGRWHCTTGGSVPAPTWWAIPEPPPQSKEAQ
jgi:hypothetical protein